MTIGNKISECRKNKGMTQDALAQLLGVTNQAVSKWESDQNCPDVMLLPKIADIFEITVDELFGRMPKKETVETVVHDLPWEDDNILRVVLYVGHKLVADGAAREGSEFSYDKDVDGVISAVSVTCGNVGGDVKAAGDVKCDTVGGNVNAGSNVYCGDVSGNVDAGSNVYCGDVGGDVDAGTSVSCGEVSGDVDAGTDVKCGNVSGSVDAGTNVSCGDVDGDVDAGCSVECGSVGGNIDAGGPVTIRNK